MNRPSCSIIIRAYNEERHIGRLLTGIREQTVQPKEIILVDSGSTDATRRIAQSRGVRIVPILPEEFSFGRSLNFGCRAATGDLLVFASAHVYPLYTDWLETLLRPFADPTVVLTYGRQQGDERTRFPEHRVFAQWFPDTSHVEQDHPFCNNANAAIRRTLWEELPYDESLTGLEDLDWAKRAMERGHRILYVTDAPVIHVHNETPMQVMNRYRREAIAFRSIYPNESFTLLSFLRFLLLNSIRDAVHALHEGVFLRECRNIVVFRFMQFFGTYRGHRQRGAVSSGLRQRFYYARGLRHGEKNRTEGAETERLIRYDDAHGQ